MRAPVQHVERKGQAQVDEEGFTKVVGRKKRWLPKEQQPKTPVINNNTEAQRDIRSTPINELEKEQNEEQKRGVNNGKSPFNSARVEAGARVGASGTAGIGTSVGASNGVSAGASGLQSVGARVGTSAGASGVGQRYEIDGKITGGPDSDVIGEVHPTDLGAFLENVSVNVDQAGIGRSLKKAIFLFKVLSKGSKGLGRVDGGFFRVWDLGIFSFPVASCCDNKRFTPVRPSSLQTVIRWAIFSAQAEMASVLPSVRDSGAGGNIPGVAHASRANVTHDVSAPMQVVLERTQIAPVQHVERKGQAQVDEEGFTKVVGRKKRWLPKEQQPKTPVINNNTEAQRDIRSTPINELEKEQNEEQKRGVNNGKSPFNSARVEAGARVGASGTAGIGTSVGASNGVSAGASGLQSVGARVGTSAGASGSACVGASVGASAGASGSYVLAQM
ncbi:hypothetical protein L6452_44749 [Arctium lappa]|nr:hypothetical protein L6452_44749 [Arctium lappa]